MTYTVKEYREDLKLLNKEIPPCVTCSDKKIDTCMESGYECPTFVLFSEEGDGKNFNYRRYHREYYRKHREKLNGKLREKYGRVKVYKSRFAKGIA